MRIFTAFAILILALASSIAAEEVIDCLNASNWQERFFCADKESTAVDAELNAVYKKALATIGKSEELTPSDAKRWEAALRASQRAWVAFRDAECNGLVMLEWTGGSDQTTVTIKCAIELTKARIESLKEHVERVR